MSREKNVAIVLAAGKGTRMGSEIPKQFLKIQDKPVLYYSLKTFQDSPLISEIILVIAGEWQDYCRKNILKPYGITKVAKMVEGGKERYDSVYAGLSSCEGCDYVFIHDGARPFITEDILQRCMGAVREHKACVVGMPSKDTVKIADSEGNIAQTPARSLVWIIQTPQVFSYKLIREAYEEMFARGMDGITDDAMVVEAAKQCKVKLVEGSYGNIKITTPEDIKIAENF